MLISISLLDIQKAVQYDISAYTNFYGHDYFLHYYIEITLSNTFGYSFQSFKT